MKALVAFVAMTFISVGSYAAPASEESIKTLFALMKSEEMLGTMYASMEQGIQQGMNSATAGRTLTKEQKLVLERAPQKMHELFASELSWAKIEPLQIAAYRETFEQAEIDGLIEFYRGPIGQAYVKKMPIAIQKSMAVTQRHMQQVMQKMKASIDEMMKEARLAPSN